jgi:hypothetical protein
MSQVHDHTFGMQQRSCSSDLDDDQPLASMLLLSDREPAMHISPLSDNATSG